MSLGRIRLHTPPPGGKLPPAMLHALAPFPIIIGLCGILAGLFWLVGVDADEDGGPSVGMSMVFGGYYLAFRVFRALRHDPMSVLPGFGFILGGAGLIWLGVEMW